VSRTLPLRVFLAALIVGSFFAIWIGSADAWWRPKEWWVFCTSMAYFAWRMFAPAHACRQLKSLTLALLFGFVCVQMAALFILPAIWARGSLSVPVWPFHIFLFSVLLWTLFKDAVECLSSKDFLFLFRVVGACGAALSLLMIGQFFHLDPVLWLSNQIGMNIKWLHNNHVVGLMGNSFQAACVLAPTVPILAALGWTIPAVLAATALVLSGSASATAAAACGVLATLWLQKKRRGFWLLLSLLLSLPIFLLRSGFFSFSGRLEIWNKSLGALLEHPILGYGLGTYQLLGITASTGNGLPNAVRWAHNEWLQIGCELGLIGLGILVCFLTNLIRKGLAKGLPASAAGALAALWVLSLASIPFHLAPTIVTGLIALAATNVHLAEEKSRESHVG
jgi:hypothetical protein